MGQFGVEDLGAVSQAAISKQLKTAGYFWIQGDWVPYELKPRDVERQFCMSKLLLESYKSK